MSTKVKDLPVTIQTKSRRSYELLDNLFDNAGIETGRQKWDDLDALYDEIAQSIMTISVEIEKSLQYMRNIDYKSNELNITINTFNEDMINLSKSAAAIRQKHAGKVGFVTSPDDLSLSMELFNDYTIIFDHFKTMVMQPSLIVTEHYAKATEMYREKQKLEAGAANETKTDETSAASN